MKGLRNRYNLSLSFPGPLVSDCAPTLSLNGLLDSHYLPDNLACSGPGRNLKLTISLMCYRVVRFKGESTEHPDKFVTLCDPMDCSIPGFPVFQYLPQFAQTHVHWVSDAIQPSHHLSPSSPAQHNLSQHQGLFQWLSGFLASAGQSIGASALESVLPVNIQGWFPLGLPDLISLLSKGLSRVFFSTTVWRNKFFSTQPFSLSSS